MAKYWTCKYGANHDIGEACDCEKEMEVEKAIREQHMKSMVIPEKNGQLVLAFGRRTSA